MKTVWKWVIGIVLGVLVLVALVGIPLFLHFSRQAAFFGSVPDWHMRNFEHMPMMRGYSGFSMIPFGGFFGALIELGLLVLVVLGIIWIVRSLRTPQVPMRACSKCGQPLQAEWKLCPHCGTKIKS